MNIVLQVIVFFPLSEGTIYGIMACPFQLSKDGIEMQFTINHIIEQDAAYSPE
jgi:hypothetical protein